MDSEEHRHRSPHRDRGGADVFRRVLFSLSGVLYLNWCDTRLNVIQLWDRRHLMAQTKIPGVYVVEKTLF